jgi:hypothetical protein
MPRKPRRKPPMVPLYVRIPAALRARIDAAAGIADPDAKPWQRPPLLQDLVIDALYKAYPTAAPNEEADAAALVEQQKKNAPSHRPTLKTGRRRQHKTRHVDADPGQHKNS